MNNITVITNSIRVVNELSNSEGIKVIAVGGRVSNNQSFIGSLAEHTIEKNYFANKVFFSSKGITKEQGILESNEYECAIKKKMIINAKEKIYLCDKSKIGRVGFSKLADYEYIDCVITDEENLGDDYIKVFEENNVKYEIV
jgi:DeoR/GlpR family transcriptional regulator of sugar metabolism